MKDSITINVSGIDQEIASLHSRIEKLQTFREQLQSYSQDSSNARAQDSSTSAQDGSTPARRKGRPKKSAESKDAAPAKKSAGKRGRRNKVGVGDFVMQYITDNPGTSGRPVAEAYADATGKTAKETTNIVYNTLSRLKKLNKIEGTPSEDKSGLTYSLATGSSAPKRKRRKSSK